MRASKRFIPAKFMPQADNPSRMRTVYIGMGGNIASWAGPPEATLARAVVWLEPLGHVVRRSSLYSTQPVGLAEQPRFVNAVVALRSELEPRDLLDRLLAIEKEFGRDRAKAVANGPRTLDLDILLFGNLRIVEPGLEIPHPRLFERGFVLVPLHEIAPEAFDAARGKTVAQLVKEWRQKAGSETDAVVRIESDDWRVGRGAALLPG